MYYWKSLFLESYYFFNVDILVSICLNSPYRAKMNCWFMSEPPVNVPGSYTSPSYVTHLHWRDLLLLYATFLAIYEDEQTMKFPKAYKMEFLNSLENSINS